MSVIENFRQQDEELAPGVIMTRCSKTSCIWVWTPKCGGSGLFHRWAIWVTQTSDGCRRPGRGAWRGGADWVTVRLNQCYECYQHPHDEWAFWGEMCHEKHIWFIQRMIQPTVINQINVKAVPANCSRGAEWHLFYFESKKREKKQ